MDRPLVAPKGRRASSWAFILPSSTAAKLPRPFFPPLLETGMPPQRPCRDIILFITSAPYSCRATTTGRTEALYHAMTARGCAHAASLPIRPLLPVPRPTSPVALLAKFTGSLPSSQYALSHCLLPARQGRLTRIPALVLARHPGPGFRLRCQSTSASSKCQQTTTPARNLGKGEGAFKGSRQGDWDFPRSQVTQSPMKRLMHITFYGAGHTHAHKYPAPTLDGTVPVMGRGAPR